MKKGERREALMRIFVAIVTGFILYFWSILAGVLAVFGWLYALVLGVRNRWVADINEYYAAAVYQTFTYLTGRTNDRPFPFGALKPMNKFS